MVQNAVTAVQNAVTAVQNLASRFGFVVSKFCIGQKLRGLIKQISPRDFFRNGAEGTCDLKRSRPGSRIWVEKASGFEEGLEARGLTLVLLRVGFEEKKPKPRKLRVTLSVGAFQSQIFEP